MVSWIIALASPSPMAAPAHSHETSGTPSPSTGISANDTKPAVNNCTAVTRRLSTRLANMPIRMISAAIATAPARVATSPGLKLSEPASGPASRISPHRPLQQRHNRHVQRRDKGRLAAGDGAQAVRLQVVPQEQCAADGDARADLESGNAHHVLAEQQHRHQAGNGKSHANEEQRSAMLHGNMDNEERASPQHGDQHQGKLLARQGEYRFGLHGRLQASLI
ncbi:hypothetical protein G6F22_015802 [Rhizopus arrhizus]|nr:hypothetical protein G6F22_015802 [Rhizopus arrhizus]